MILSQHALNITDLALRISLADFPSISSILKNDFFFHIQGLPCMSNTVLGAKDMMISKTVKNPCPHGACFQSNTTV